MYFFFFFLGIIIGSFLNEIILRYEKDEAITGRSHCPHCGTQLVWYELIPLFSYLFQLGRCRSCKKFLTMQYPLVEFATGALFVISFIVVVGPIGSVVNISSFLALSLLMHLIIWSLFVVITVYDFRTKCIPDVFSYSLAGIAFLHLFIQNGAVLMPSYWDLLAGPLLFLPFYFLWKVSNGRWLGLGDGKLALGIGWFLGFSFGGTAILFAFWIGAVVSVGIIVVQRLFEKTILKMAEETLTLKSEVPFGPFMVLGTLIVYVTHVNIFMSSMF
jgi:prepilin signal peptidase PulO-like enzyme (type II secretory pathway)